MCKCIVTEGSSTTHSPSILHKIFQYRVEYGSEHNHNEDVVESLHVGITGGQLPERYREGSGDVSKARPELGYSRQDGQLGLENPLRFTRPTVNRY